ncbi:ATP-binding cassette domain-containing protein, partial [Leifsonia sp. SIMBA_070]|uniref:ATP-binding cassette domain-containing protein n=1 Tax=Leifsonia sp. SIMBA_070 TaxID=3085810 RepID=UPI00397D03F4
VSFTYPGAEQPILSHVTFRADPGETVAIIGSTGSGKTTLVSLIPRLFDATSGSVSVQGVDVTRADLDELWKGIGLVPQRPFLFSGTIASNLRFGREDATDEELWKALE